MPTLSEDGVALGRSDTTSADTPTEMVKYASNILEWMNT